MLKPVSIILLSISLLVLSFTANASLITNGSFEQVTFEDNFQSIDFVDRKKLQAFENNNGLWDIFKNLPGWITSHGKGIELQKNVITSAQHGSNLVELDSTKNSVMTQTLKSLTVGADYQLDFYYKPRTNKKNDNGIKVYWYDEATTFKKKMQTSFISNSTSSLTPNWIVQSVTLTAVAETMNLSFGAFGKNNSLGGFIDNVSLVQVSEVPEPSVFALFLFGFALLAFRKAKKINK